MAEHTGFDVKSSYLLQINSLPDSAIYNLAKEKGNIIIVSKDADFNELINRLGALPMLITIKKGNCDNREMWEFIKPIIAKAVKLLTTTDIDIVKLD